MPLKSPLSVGFQQQRWRRQGIKKERKLIFLFFFWKIKIHKRRHWRPAVRDNSWAQRHPGKPHFGCPERDQVPQQMARCLILFWQRRRTFFFSIFNLENFMAIVSGVEHYTAPRGCHWIFFYKKKINARRNVEEMNWSDNVVWMLPDPCCSRLTDRQEVEESNLPGDR